MSPDDLRAALQSLSERRPVFHSEADFQHELAWRLREQGVTDVRLERPFYLGAEPINLDLLLLVGGERVAIELKYWKRGRALDVRGERFVLKNQAAQDISRYDFWWDVSRLERLRAAGAITRGYAVAIASDPGYWQEGRPGTVDRAFRLHHGRVVVGTLAWTGAGPGTIRGREDPIALQGAYTLDWRDYAEPEPGYPLRALVVPVGWSGDVGAVDASPIPLERVEQTTRRRWSRRARGWR